MVGSVNYLAARAAGVGKTDASLSAMRAVNVVVKENYSDLLEKHGDVAGILRAAAKLDTKPSESDALMALIIAGNRKAGAVPEATPGTGT
jgi:hypothetical protein